jgi:hypothetical protein
MAFNSSERENRSDRNNNLGRFGAHRADEIIVMLVGTVNCESHREEPLAL